MTSLWRAPIADLAAPPLRDLIPELASSTQHERYAAHALASLDTEPEPGSWVDSDDPVLRAVAATTIAPMDGDVLNAHLRQLLDDPDGYVQEAALRHVARVRPPDVADILIAATTRPRPGWMCLSCRTVNPMPGSTSCSKDGCLRVGADPAKTAAELLETSTNDAGLEA
jgi:hypothetical protein